MSLFLIIAGLALVFSVLMSFSRLRVPVVVASLALLFLPFGILVGIGWVIPKALSFILPYVTLKDVIS